MNTFILLYILAGHAPAQLGTYSSLDSCTNAIRQLYLANIYIAQQLSPEVQKAIEDSGKLIGVCEYRPRFGRFEVSYV